MFSRCLNIQNTDFVTFNICYFILDLYPKEIEFLISYFHLNMPQLQLQGKRLLIPLVLENCPAIRLQQG